MPTWKKVVVSGSVAELRNLSVDQNVAITGSLSALGLISANKPNIVSYDVSTGQFTYQGTGSFTATSASYVPSAGVDGPLGMNSVLSASYALTSSLALRTAGTLSQGTGVSTFSFDGSGNAQVAVSGASTLSTNAITKWTGTAFANSSLTDNGLTITGNTSIQLTGTGSVLSGSFSGSFRGDGSGLTGLATTLRVTGSDNSNGSVNLLTQGLTITGTANEIETSVAGQTVTVGLPNNVVIGNNLTVTNNLTVFGTASFQNTSNLEVSDRFILLASGSNAAGDGGLVVQQATQDVGELFGYDSGTQRWAVTGSFKADQSGFTPDAFMAAAVEGTAATPTGVAGRYSAKGNLFIGNDESIWIFS